MSFVCLCPTCGDIQIKHAPKQTNKQTNKKAVFQAVDEVKAIVKKSVSDYKNPWGVSLLTLTLLFTCLAEISSERTFDDDRILIAVSSSKIFP